MDNYFIIIGYLIYLPISIVLTYFVAKTLFKSGKVFMLDIFSDREAIAVATNNLFEVGFYLVNVGFALLILKIGTYIATTQNLIEVLSTKIGGFSVYLGIMLFLNLFFFFRGKRKASEAREKRQFKEEIRNLRGGGLATGPNPH